MQKKYLPCGKLADRIKAREAVRWHEIGVITGQLIANRLISDITDDNWIHWLCINKNDPDVYSGGSITQEHTYVHTYVYQHQTASGCRGRDVHTW